MSQRPIQLAREVEVFGAERRQAILDLLRVRGSVTISDLATTFGVSEVTVRRDVNTLEKRHLLIRGHGGAMLPEAVPPAGLRPGTALQRPAVFGAERRRLIAQLVRANRAVALADLVETMAVSEMTIRRDLDILERRGVLERRHGGALSVAMAYDPGAVRGAPSFGPSLDGRSGDGSTFDAIGALAATLAAVDGPIMLGGGASVYALARRLRPVAPMTVLTTSVPVARALADVPHVSLVVAAGALDGHSQSLVGSAAERWVARHRVRRAFVAGAGVTTSRGLSSASLAASSIARAIVDGAEETVVLAHRDLFGVETTWPVAAVDEIDHLVVDDVADEILRPFADLGVKVHRALGGFELALS